MLQKERLPHNHYSSCKVQPLEIMSNDFTPEEYRGFLKGNILKYLLRLGKKDPIEQELSKIKTYVGLLEDSYSGITFTSSTNFAEEEDKDSKTDYYNDDWYEDYYDYDYEGVVYDEY